MIYDLRPSTIATIAFPITDDRKIDTISGIDRKKKEKEKKANE